jgi:hypothetical protein
MTAEPRDGGRGEADEFAVWNETFAELAELDRGVGGGDVVEALEGSRVAPAALTGGALRRAGPVRAHRLGGGLVGPTDGR